MSLPSTTTMALSLDAGVLSVVLHRDPCNEIGEDTLADLESLAAFLADDAEGARAMVISSRIERGFSAGADLRALHAGIVSAREAGATAADVVARVRTFIERIHRALDAIDRAPIPTVAAVHGVCFGGGLELALACDVIVADKSARFAFPELRLGLVPGFGGIPRLARDVGNAAIRDLLFSGRTLNATRAHTLGLVSQVVGRGEAPRAATALATNATRFDAATIRAAKDFIKPHPVEELARERALFVELFCSPAVERALERFVTSTDVRPYLP